MPGHRSWHILRDRLAPNQKAEVEAKVRELQAEMLLIEVCKLERSTRSDLVELLGIDQPTRSELKSHDDMQVSTLRRIVQALEGELDITIRMPNGSYRLAGLTKNTAST